MLLGVPSRLALQALDLGSQLVGSPGASFPAGVAAEREAGYILLGAAAVVLPQEALAGGAATDFLACWRHALRASSAAQLDITKYLTVG